MKEQAKNKALSWTDYRVRDWLLETIGPSNDYRHISQSEIATELGLYPGDVSKSIKHLVELDILLCRKDKDNAKRRQYRFHSSFCFAMPLIEAMKAKHHYIKELLGVDEETMQNGEGKGRWIN